MNAFEEGYKDFGKGQLVNPYNKNTPKHRDWEFGFNKAWFRNLERVKEKNARRGSRGLPGKKEA